MSEPRAKTFFDLPAELRNSIYELIIPTNDNVELNNQYGEMHANRPPVLCLVNRQMRSEALTLWRSSNCFTVLTNTKEKLDSWIDSQKMCGLEHVRHCELMSRWCLSYQNETHEK